VAGVGSSAGSYTICSALVDLAHDLGLRVVAEGATDDRDVYALRRMGCDRVQGFVLGHPVPLAQLADLCSLTIDEVLGTGGAPGASSGDVTPR
jgi:EAL domain-containing protein (putative c-di-GMP-specific phosphodiesterase class I)